MPRKRTTPEQIISKLREAEFLLSQGHPVASICSKKSGVGCPQLVPTDLASYIFRRECNLSKGGYLPSTIVRLYVGWTAFSLGGLAQMFWLRRRSRPALKVLHQQA